MPGVWSTPNRPRRARALGVDELADVVGLGEGEDAAAHHPRGLRGHSHHRVAEQVPVARVDPGGGVVVACDRRDARTCSSTWPCGDEHADRLEPVLRARPRRHPRWRPCRGRYHALAACRRRHDVAVRAPRTRGKAGDQHRPRYRAQGMGCTGPRRERRDGRAMARRRSEGRLDALSRRERADQRRPSAARGRGRPVSPLLQVTASHRLQADGRSPTCLTTMTQ